MTDQSALGPWVKRFLLEYLHGERNFTRNTQQSYRDALRLLIVFAAGSLHKKTRSAPRGRHRCRLTKEVYASHRGGSKVQRFYAECAKHQRKGAGTTRYSDQLLHDRFGLVRLAQRTASFPWATP